MQTWQPASVVTETLQSSKLLPKCAAASVIRNMSKVTTKKKEIQTKCEGKLAGEVALGGKTRLKPQRGAANVSL